MKTYMVVTACFLSLTGCDSQPVNTPASRTATTPAEPPNTGPWSTVASDDDYGTIGSEIDFQDDGPDLITYDVQRVRFGDLLRDIGEMTDSSVTCADPGLMDKAVTVKISGPGAQGVLNDMATKLNLTLTGTGASFELAASATEKTP